MGRSGKPRSLKVVAALIRERQSRQVLLTQRRPGRHLGLSWEFPGGKVEAGESAFDALVRELTEELGVHTLAAEPFKQVRHRYPARTVLLDVWTVTSWRGEPRGLECQPIAWVMPAELHRWPMPPADAPIVDALGAGPRSSARGTGACP